MAGNHHSHHYSGQREPAKVAAAQLSRRRLFAGVGAGTAGAIALGATGGPAQAQGPAGEAPPDRFGRLFPNLPAGLPATDAVRNALIQMGAPGGLMDANDDLAAGPVELIIDPDLSINNPNNTTHTAGTTFVGQFLDHDITFDTTSPLGVPKSPQDSPNSRTPALDLDSVYGAGPVAEPVFYESDQLHLRIESNGEFEDIAREPSGRPIISDPRNNENEMLKGIHAAFILLHNNVVDQLQSDGFGNRAEIFDEARRIVTWHYQWLVVHEFLPLFVGQSMVDDILNNGRQFYTPSGSAFIPIEFQLAYRFGHSMVRPSYRLNRFSMNGEAFFGFIFDRSQDGLPDPDDLRAFDVRAPRRFVGWETFFDFGDGEVRPNKLIDRVLSTPLFDLPLPTIPDNSNPTSLPQRNLLRHITWETPSGQAIAQAMGNQPLVLNELAGFGQDLQNSTPIWYYALAEAEDLAGGVTLGPTGGRIVGEVFIGLMQLDPTAYLAVDPNWTPFLGPNPGQFTMTDFLTAAGVDPASRGDAPPQGDCGVSVSLDNEWDDGYVIQVVVTNNTGATISGWSANFTLPAGHQLVNTWAANVAVNGTSATATGVSFNSSLGAGQSAFWGFQASRPNDGQLASGFSCSVS
jgi:hypothetical protein